jgi:hypothetical protein
MEQFWFWPLFIGYEVKKNSSAPFPHDLEFAWYNLPFLSMANGNIEQDVQTSTTLSFLLMTYFQEVYVQEKYTSRAWYSLFLFSSYNSETLWEDDKKIANVSWTNPLFSFQDTHILLNKQIFPVYEWEISPAALLLGDDSPQIVRQARWGNDHLFQLFSLNSFSLFTISTSFYSYPGSRYQHFLQYETEESEAKLFASSMAFPKNRMGFFAPFLVFETSPDGSFAWQVLPLFSYSSQNYKHHFYILPLFLDLGSEGVALSFQPKFFPLFYHDELYGTWDILWPVFCYTDNPDMPDQRFTMRFIIDYHITQNRQKKNTVDFSLLERLLASYQYQEKSTQLEVLPGGILFGYYEDDTKTEWRILGCGYQSTSHSDYLQILFIKIPWKDKHF